MFREEREGVWEGRGAGENGGEEGSQGQKESGKEDGWLGRSVRDHCQMVEVLPWRR